MMNPATTPDEAAVLEVLEHPALPVGVLRELSGHPSSYVREGVARHPRLTPELAERLEDDLNAFVLTALSRNPRTPGAVLDRLADSEFASVRAGVAGNPSTFPSTLVRLVGDGSRYVLSALAGNERTPQPVLLALARLPITGVRRNLAHNPASDEEVLRLVGMGSKEGGEFVVRRYDLSADIVSELASHPHRKVRYGAALHEAAPVSVVEALLDDDHPSVRRAAGIALDRRGLALVDS